MSTLSFMRLGLKAQGGVSRLCWLVTTGLVVMHITWRRSPDAERRLASASRQFGLYRALFAKPLASGVASQKNVIRYILGVVVAGVADHSRAVAAVLAVQGAS